MRVWAGVGGLGFGVSRVRCEALSWNFAPKNPTHVPSTSNTIGTLFAFDLRRGTTTVAHGDSGILGFGLCRDGATPSPRMAHDLRLRACSVVAKTGRRI